MRVNKYMIMEGYYYIEVKGWEDRGVITRIYVTNRSISARENIEEGLNEDIDSEKYYTCNYTSAIQLDEI